MMEISLGFLLLSSIIIFRFALIYLQLLDKAKKNLRSVSEDLGDVKFTQKDYYEGKYQGIPYEYEFTGRKGLRGPYFHVSLACSLNGQFEISKKHHADALFKKWGIIKEVETGDPTFDDLVFIKTDMPEFAQKFFAEQNKRDAVKRLFSLGYNRIKKDGFKIEIFKVSFQAYKNVDKTFVENGIMNLVTLSQDLPQVNECLISDEGSARAKKWEYYIFSWFIMIAGFVMLPCTNVFYPALDKYDILFFSLKFSLPAFTVFFFMAVKKLKGRSSSHHELLLIFALCIFGVPLFGYGIASFYNSQFDTARSQEHQVLILEKESIHDYVYTSTWRDDQEKEEFNLGRNQTAVLVPGESQVIVTTKPGKLGFEWVVDVQRVEEENED